MAALALSQDTCPANGRAPDTAHLHNLLAEVACLLSPLVENGQAIRIADARGLLTRVREAKSTLTKPRTEASHA